MKVGFIGLGAMGLPMARRILNAGFELHTTAHRRREPADALAAQGAHVHATATEVAQVADVIITILPADKELKETALLLLPALTAGKVLIEMTTATALTLEEVAATLDATGARILDAPVSGGTVGAETGTLTIMVGGDADLLEQCRPVLEAMGNRIVHVGKVGQGKVVKMVNQVMAATHLLIAGEAFALGVRCGADPHVMYDVIKTSSGQAKVTDSRLPDFLLKNHFEPGFKLDLMKKDVNLAVQTAQALGAPMLLTSAVAQIFAAASAAGSGEKDFAAAAQYLASLANVQLGSDQQK